MPDLETTVDEAFTALEREDEKAFNEAAEIVQKEMGWTKMQTVEFFSGIRIEIVDDQT